MRPVKCLHCTVLIDRAVDEYTQVNKRYIHISCLKEVDTDKNTRKELNSFLLVIFENDVNFGIVGKQIKSFETDYKYTLSGILGTLHYCYSVKKIKFTSSQGIGIVPFLYKEAKKYFQTVERGQENSNIAIDYKKISVNIKSPKSYLLKKIDEIQLEEL